MNTAGNTLNLHLCVLFIFHCGTERRSDRKSLTGLLLYINLYLSVDNRKWWISYIDRSLFISTDQIIINGCIKLDLKNDPTPSFKFEYIGPPLIRIASKSYNHPSFNFKNLIFTFILCFENVYDYQLISRPIEIIMAYAGVSVTQPLQGCLNILLSSKISPPSIESICKVQEWISLWI